MIVSFSPPTLRRKLGQLEAGPSSTNKSCLLVDEDVVDVIILDFRREVGVDLDALLLRRQRSPSHTPRIAHARFQSLALRWLEEDSGTIQTHLCHGTPKRSNLG